MISMKLVKLLKLPTPKDLKMSESSCAMQVRMFYSGEGYTWEDYYEYLKKHFPIKFFIGNTIYNICMWFRVNVFMTISNKIYYIKSKYIIKDHLLDLRQSNHSNDFGDHQDDYSFGYLEPDYKLKYAIFNILDIYVKHRYIITKEDLEKDPDLQEQYDFHQKITYLHDWWHIYRKEDLKQFDELQDKLFKIEDRKSEEYKSLMQDITIMEQDIQKELTEMMVKVVSLREGLWT